MKRWPLYNPYFWEFAPFFRLLMPLAAGIVVYDAKWLPDVAGMVCLWVMAGLWLVYAATVLNSKSGQVHRHISFAALQAALFIGGYALTFFDDARNNAQWCGHTISANSACLVRISDAPVEKETTWKLPVAILASAGNSKVAMAAGKAVLYLYKDKAPMLLHKGDSVLAPGRWEPVRNAGNPFEFDYAGYSRRNNIFMVQHCSMKDVRLYAAADPAAAPLTARAHDWCMQQLATYMPDGKARGLVQAMLLGDEVNLDEDLRQSYADTGIVHIIAISGGNVGIFFLFISFLLRWLSDKKHQWIKYAVALPMVWFYVLMAGASPSAMRAAIMFSLLAVGVMLQKNNNSLNLLFATAFFLLCADPQWLFAVGFQLSFVAVLSIILFYKPVYGWLTPEYAIARGLWSSIAASIAAEVLVAPVVIYYFHMFPVLFAIANAAAFVFMGIVLILGMLIIVLSQVAVLPGALGMATQWLVYWFDVIVARLQQLSPAPMHRLVLTNAELAAAYLVIAGVMLYAMRRHRRALFTGLGAACVLAAMLCRDEWQTLHRQVLVVYNAGKAGHAELIQGHSYRVLYTDTAAAAKIKYVVTNAHTMWHAWQQSSNEAAAPLYSIGGKTALVLTDDVSMDNRLPVDYLLICTASLPDAVQLQRAFAPRLVVLGSSYTRQQRSAFMQQAADAGLEVYPVADSGAFVLDGAMQR